MKLIQTISLASTSIGVVFSSIPQTPYTDLLVLVSSRSARLGNSAPINVTFNGVTTDQTRRTLYGNGSSVGSQTPTDYIGWTTALSDTANTFGSTSIYIPNYAGSTNKSFSADVVQEHNGTASFQTITAGLWSQTAAITSLTISDQNGTDVLVSGTTISLYGITKGSDGIVTTS